MKFDIDRFAKLAGMRTAAESTKSAAPVAPAAVLKESAGRLAESAEIKNLRHIIRSETRAILAANKTSKTVSDDALVEGVQRSKSLTEAMTTLGFLGPGFGGNNSFALGGAMTSASRFASLNEEDEMAGHTIESAGADDSTFDNMAFYLVDAADNEDYSEFNIDRNFLEALSMGGHTSETLKPITDSLIQSGNKDVADDISALNTPAGRDALVKALKSPGQQTFDLGRNDYYR
jgi:hypothetical protein